MQNLHAKLPELDGNVVSVQTNIRYYIDEDLGADFPCVKIKPKRNFVWGYRFVKTNLFGNTIRCSYHAFWRILIAYRN